MVICHLGIVDYPPDIMLMVCRQQPGPGQLLQQLLCRLSHILGDIPAVRAGVGNQPCFIELLQRIQCFQCRISAQPVGFPLQGGQIHQLRRLLDDCFLGHSGHIPVGAPAALHQFLGLSFGGNFSRPGKASKVGSDNKILDRLEVCYFPIPLYHQCYRWCLHPAHRQSPVIDLGVQTGQVHSDHPIGLLAASCRFIQQIIVLSGLPRLQRSPDR